jgi:hypothetical protein
MNRSLNSHFILNRCIIVFHRGFLDGRLSRPVTMQGVSGLGRLEERLARASGLLRSLLLREIIRLRTDDTLMLDPLHVPIKALPAFLNRGHCSDCQATGRAIDLRLKTASFNDFILFFLIHIVYPFLVLRFCDLILFILHSIILFQVFRRFPSFPRFTNIWFKTEFLVVIRFFLMHFSIRMPIEFESLELIAQL